LSALQKQVALYFKDTEISKFEWVRNPLASNVSGRLTSYEQEQLIDKSLKNMSDADKALNGWLLVKSDCQSIRQSNKGFTSFVEVNFLLLLY
jgi:hypothetical protein